MKNEISKILYNYLLIGTMRCDILDITSETINVREPMCRLPALCIIP